MIRMYTYGLRLVFIDFINYLPLERNNYEPLKVTYTAFDKAGNMNECSFDVIPTSGKLNFFKVLNASIFIGYS